MRAARSLCLAGSAIALCLPAAAHADVIVGPRLAYYFDNSNLRTSSIAGGVQEEGGAIDQASFEFAQDLLGPDLQLTTQQEGIGVLADQIAIPMVGAMVNFGDDRDRFTISALYGEGEGRFSQTQAISRVLSFRERQAVDFGVATVGADFDYTRIDIEATWQRRTSENFAILAGFRYERLERSGTGETGIGLTPNVDNFLDELVSEELGINPGEPFEQRPLFKLPIADTGTQETFSARAGVTAFVPINENATAFFNGMVHTSLQPEFSTRTQFFLNGEVAGNDLVEDNAREFSVGPDFAVGAQFVLSDSLALDVRYRANIFFPLSGDQSFSDARVNHGVNVGLSLRL
ncbi:MAG: hypothetical protein AAF127_02475 [Pseudomonadota bacterium]